MVVKNESLQAVRQLVRLLVDRDYDGVVRSTRASRGTSSELEAAVALYGRTLTMPPDGVQWIDAVRVERDGAPRWSVTCRLWTVEEGPSDLSLELTIEEGDGVSIDVDDLHVL